MTAALCLKVLTGPHKGQLFCVRDGRSCIVGRAAECDICLCGAERDRSISRRHCHLWFMSPVVHVADLGSTNGTFINGHRAGDADPDAPRQLFDPRAAIGLARDGDILTIGGTSFQLLIGDCPAPCPETGPAMPVPVDCPLRQVFAAK
ncbi:MAG: FHA domain-containing protein [Gemmataceae bacterium]|nr:FHA domain-containing protein [Gemmataceae bacterium]MDW8266218.1 FHA domain-containing protein [Gemmataceae bacterium]